MARRTSARLRARVSSTPQAKRVSDFGNHDGIRTPKTAPRLTSLAESDEMPGAFPQSGSTSPVVNSPGRLAEHIAQAITGQHSTPKRATPIRPSNEEMHPQKYQMSTAKPLDEARWLGFSSMAPHTEPAKGLGTNKIALAQGTPTKVQKSKIIFEPPSRSDFTFSRPSLGLSPEARKLMEDKKEEANKIKEQMLASQEASIPTASDLLARKMATPKGKAGRFSDVHMSAFKRLESIANHPSAFRADKSAAGDASSPKKLTSQPVAAINHSLKRTQSKADLGQSSSALPRSTSKRDLQQQQTSTSTDDAPAKRVKRTIDDDTATSRPKSSSSDDPSTPAKSQSLKSHSNLSRKRSLGTPTAASLARAASVKSIKSVKRTGIPALTRSPSKPGMTSAGLQQSKPSTPLLSRSPSKMAWPGAIAESKSVEPESPLLSRSAVKPAANRQPAPQADDPDEIDSSSAMPYMARSPSKMSVSVRLEGDEKSSKMPLLSRSPSKIAMPADAFSNTAKTPAKTAGASLMNRFNLLRASPVKSILRTPQRLYSNDPAKIARGTHFSTPEKADSTVGFLAVPPKTAPVRKHVDFTASTKGVTDIGDKPDTPSKKLSDERDEAVVDSPSSSGLSQTAPNYPSLPAHEPLTKKNRRMTMAFPSDFTFRAGSTITFAKPTDRKDTNRKEGDENRKASIRQISAEPEITPAASKKRKLSNQDEESATSQKLHESSDKENGATEPLDEQRPAKRARPSAPEAQTPKVAKAPRKFSTLGVKPKSTGKPREKRPGFLSQERLNALATPKRRR